MRKYMSKRQRPCDPCRSRKTACRIDHAPPCRACALSRTECTFLQDAPPRKRPTKGQDSAGSDLSTAGEAQCPEGMGLGMDVFSNRLHEQDETVQQMLYHDSDGLMSGLHMDLDVSGYSFLPAMSPFGSHQEAHVTTAHHAPFTTGGSPLIQTIDQMEDGCPQVIGLSSDMDPFLLHRYRADDSGFFHFKQLSIQSVQSHPYPVQFLTSKRSLVAKTREDAGDTDIPDAQLRAELEGVVSAPTGRRLLSLFRTYVEPQYPIFSTEALPDPASSPVHLLAAAYAAAFPFSMYDDQLCIDLAYDTPPYADLSRLINLSLQPDLHSPTISVAQTLVLLVIRPLANPLVAEAPYKGSLMGSLAAVAVTLGLHLDASSWNIPSWQVALRRRLSFVIYCLDKWMAASLGRPRQLRDDDWVVTSLESSDREGTQRTDLEWDCLVHSSHVARVLDSALSSLFSLRASQEIANDPRYALSIIEPLLESLSPVPSNLSENDSPLATVQSLGHHYVRLLTIRAASRPAVQTSATQRDNSMASSEMDPNVAELLREAAYDFVQFIKSIKTDAMQVFWPPWCPAVFSTLCFTLLSAVVTSSDETEATSWLALLQTTRRELRIKATTLPVLRLGLLRIDAVFWRGLDNVLRLKPHVHAAVQATLST
ncbi:fungal-specific transcription factor [Emericellopsis atlantica]|uniref:Fungal-specific transcription factor n=1 Tax=Emericellopsis atlantica TaxID=2614577 RepID=A0A9P7ZUP1_9HYPO|nr:fungal-specific transcription factor [Emericellopsis atlantica]KAG9258126.1 fungal-specific transcription factor [Emericellopsis atlantica]